MASKKAKMMALVFVFLMFGSTFAFALLRSFGNRGNEIKIPRQRILNYELNEQQKRYLLRRGFTLIEYTYPVGCMDCIDVKNNLERITQTSENQIFLQELTDGTSKVTITSLSGQEVLEDPTNEEIEEMACKLLMKKPIWCVTAKI